MMLLMMMIIRGWAKSVAELGIYWRTDVYGSHTGHPVGALLFPIIMIMMRIIETDVLQNQGGFQSQGIEYPPN